MEPPQRKPNRIKGYDYSQSGAYFITICTQDRKKILSKISVGTPLPGCPETVCIDNGHPRTGVPTVELLWHGEIADKYIKKLLGLRIFQDENGKTNLALKDVEGELLLVSQFTLYADCKKGNRPSFTAAGAPDRAKELYEYIIAKCKARDLPVQEGSFGADMAVELVNDGPVTIWIDSQNKE